MGFVIFEGQDPILRSNSDMKRIFLGAPDFSLLLFSASAQRTTTKQRLIDCCSDPSPSTPSTSYFAKLQGIVLLTYLREPVNFSMPSNLRRLAADHAALHNDLPPYYLKPSEDDDLSQLNIFLTGPPGTPFSEGLWRLDLKMPVDYPQSPPKATFKTKIWHPNVEELTGAVCVDTLKRDWQPNLTLRDVLVTISCLLIYPNPDSALNSSAGALLQENYAAFAHQAKLMASIHAPIPFNLKDAVNDAKLRGDDTTAVIEGHQEISLQRARRQRRTHTAATKKPMRRTTPIDTLAHSHPFAQGSQSMSDDENTDGENEANASKENDPSLSPSPVNLAPPSPRKTALGKRPLSVLSIPYPEDEADMMLVDQDSDTDSPTLSSNEQNITANLRSRTSSPLRKTPKLSLLSRGINASGRLHDTMPIFEDFPSLSMADPSRRLSGDGKENRGSATIRGLKEKRDLHHCKALNSNPHLPTSLQHTPTPSLSSSIPVSKISKSKKSIGGLRKTTAMKAKPRLGVRRL
ncbi:Ubiquitin-conjugating enzyme E2 [Penicillium nucicola]|uniref:Ubiquitin-conjugating enzyme E2 n=1 Tax=Penicillium nucicola TaxID=1850975 RepID=UPI002545838E|nr:Ubiquitin-conjugating enzyme E2 [Penicillium nucicola]KAJ5767196.1 Ubiquitin-conjugating enzyme E2 [Penicillium nucicola]